MKITNRNNIPTTIADAMAKAQARYSKGESWMSVTGLQRPPRISILSKKNWNKLEEDVSDSVWKLFGTTMHNILEDGESSSNSLIKEERFFGDFLGKKISGAVDLQEITDFGIEIGDYKVTKAISVMKNSFSIPSWTLQLNAYAELCQVNKGLPITRLYICAFVRDHSPREAERNPEYPQSPIHILEIDRWTREQRVTWIEDKVRMHETAELIDETTGDPPPCTREDRWERGDKWAVKASADSTRAKKVFTIKDEAVAYASENSKWIIEERLAEPIRCQSYCEVSKFCNQYKEMKNEKKR